eukprot:3112197-Amphidinium_carterae.1
MNEALSDTCQPLHHKARLDRLWRTPVAHRGESGELRGASSEIRPRSREIIEHSSEAWPRRPKFVCKEQSALSGDTGSNFFGVSKRD